MFVNLAEQHKGLAPRAFHVHAADMPIVEANGAQIKVVAGQYGNVASPLTELATPVTMLDVTLQGHEPLALALDPAYRWFLFVIAGAGEVVNGVPLQASQVALLSAGGTTLTLRASAVPLRLLVCGGQTIGEPIVWGGPFCMTSTAAIQAAHARFRSGDMGRLDASF